MDETTTDFGYQQVPVTEKTSLVGNVFSSVASKYDLMNDLMSAGIHRVWKKIAVQHCALKPGQTVLDLAGGTGDLSYAFSKAVGDQGKVYLADINAAMLEAGKEKLLNLGVVQNVNYVQLNAEALPFADNFFDCIAIGFGLRNVTHKDLALQQMFRVLKPGGRVVILEFSKPVHEHLRKAYDVYSFNVLPWLGKLVAQDADSYRYLAESIRMHPDQEKLKTMLEEAGLQDCSYLNLTGGICAIHKGFKF
ncbi:MAG TPA: bifunctional demethylmenaquinone methyltransferase/2-methoxy-6-polyprenyl-1,4-benzoquinol methylase UbiE [Gammaproteobacteria bacterium]|nr:bifunctional demethylmenaquinone methyltransferase/2-methoxy-6-polyprenyl-1,4-benzoquinol methylase UbiE [Gammaproteobacteria bacterium]